MSLYYTMQHLLFVVKYVITHNLKNLIICLKTLPICIPLS